MTYHVTIERTVLKGVAKLHPRDGARVLAAIHLLAEDPRPTGAKRLVGDPVWRIRVGDYRILYDINDGELLVLVLAVGHRREVYR